MRQPAVAARLQQIIADYSGWHFANTNPEQGMDPPAARRLAELKLPVLAIVGELDTPDFWQITALIGREVPRVRTLIVPNAGHMASIEAPEQVTQALPGFLKVSTK